MYSSFRQFYNNKKIVSNSVSDKPLRVLPDFQPYITSPLKSPNQLVLVKYEQFNHYGSYKDWSVERLEEQHHWWELFPGNCFPVQWHPHRTYWWLGHPQLLIGMMLEQEKDGKTCGSFWRCLKVCQRYKFGCSVSRFYFAICPHVRHPNLFPNIQF